MPAGTRKMTPGWGGKFRGCGYRMTLPRQAILNVLQKTDKHLSAEDIYMEAHKIFPQLGLTTVYRTLELLTDMGEINKFDFGDGRARYEMMEVSEKDHHHHLVCIKCKRIVNYSDFVDEELEFLKRAEKGLSKKYNFEINNHIIQFYGICDKCGKTKKG